MNQSISVEQSQSDRSKRPFKPVLWVWTLFFIIIAGIRLNDQWFFPLSYQQTGATTFKNVMYVVKLLLAHWLIPAWCTSNVREWGTKCALPILCKNGFGQSSKANMRLWQFDLDRLRAKFLTFSVHCFCVEKLHLNTGTLDISNILTLNWRSSSGMWTFSLGWNMILGVKLYSYSIFTSVNITYHMRWMIKEANLRLLARSKSRQRHLLESSGVTVQNNHALLHTFKLDHSWTMLRTTKLSYCFGRTLGCKIWVNIDTIVLGCNWASLATDALY